MSSSILEPTANTNNNALENTGGKPGRPKGRLSSSTLEVRDMARSMLNDDEYLANLKKRLKSGDAPPAVETMLWYYAYGKPKEVVELQGEIGVSKIVREIVRADDTPVIDVDAVH